MDTAGSTQIDAKKLYPLREAAVWLKVKEQTVASYLRKRTIRGKQIGPKKHWHVRGAEIIRLRKKWGYDDDGVA